MATFGEIILIFIGSFMSVTSILIAKFELDFCGKVSIWTFLQFFLLGIIVVGLSIHYGVITMVAK